MPSINNYTGMGHLAKEPMLRTTQSGKTLANFTLAISTGKNSTLWLDCTVFEQSADYLNGVQKGALVAVEGRLVEDEWEDNNTGQKRKKIKCLCHRAHFCRNANQHGAPQSTDEEQGQDAKDGQMAADANAGKGEDSSIPF